jgi:hypothetical protein
VSWDDQLEQLIGQMFLKADVAASLTDNNPSVAPQGRNDPLV